MVEPNFRMGFFVGIIPGQIFVCAVMSASGPATTAFPAISQASLPRQLNK